MKYRYRTGIDLHTHTLESDGGLSPEDLIQLAKKQGVHTLAVTDHDTVGAVERATLVGEQMGIKVISGVELSVQEGSHSLHILGLFIRNQDPELLSFFAERLQLRRKRVGAMVERLKGVGINLDAQEILGRIKGQPGRLHVAEAMVAAGHVTEVSKAFDKYLGTGKPGYVPYEKLNVAQGVEILLNHGAIPILAHPGLLNLADDDLIQKWVMDGLMGLEVFHPKHHASQIDRYLALARVKGLLMTGGSDFHRIGLDSKLPLLPGDWGPTPEHLKRLELSVAELVRLGADETLKKHQERQRQLW